MTTLARQLEEAIVEPLFQNKIEPGDNADPIANYFENGHKVRLGYPNPDYTDDEDFFAEAVDARVREGASFDDALVEAAVHALGLDREVAVELLDEAKKLSKKALVAKAKKVNAADKGGPYKGSTAGFGGGNFGTPEPAAVKPEAKKIAKTVKKAAEKKSVKRKPGMKMVFGTWRKVG